MWRRAFLWSAFLCFLLVACSGSQTGEAVLLSAIEKWQAMKSYQLEADMQINGERFVVKQWFLAPGQLRSVITKGAELEYILITSSSGAWAYSSQLKTWSSITEDNPYPVFVSSSMPALLEMLLVSDMVLSEELSTLKISFRGAEQWDYGELTLCRKKLVPEKVILSCRETEIILNVSSFVGNLNLAPDMFLPGR